MEKSITEMIAGDPQDVPVTQQIFNQRLGSKCGVQLRRDHATTLVPEKTNKITKKNKCVCVFYKVL